VALLVNAEQLVEICFEDVTEIQKTLKCNWSEPE
jgi:hypothetical protein